MQTTSGTTLLVAIEENQATNVRWIVVEGHHQPLGVFRTYDIPIARWWKAAHGASAGSIINRLVFTNDNDSLLSLGDVSFDHLSLYEKSDIAPAPPAPVVTGPLFYVNDHLGTPLALNDVTGSTKWSTQREPWGQRVNDANLLPGLVQPFELPGQYADSESGLRYNWHRYLDASSGRYLQTDPLGLEGGDDTLYTYGAADPLDATDPTGLVWKLVKRVPGAGIKVVRNLKNRVEAKRAVKRGQDVLGPGKKQSKKLGEEVSLEEGEGGNSCHNNPHKEGQSPHFHATNANGDHLDDLGHIFYNAAEIFMLSLLDSDGNGEVSELEVLDLANPFVLEDNGY